MKIIEFSGVFFHELLVHQGHLNHLGPDQKNPGQFILWAKTSMNMQAFANRQMCVGKQMNTVI